MADHAEVLEFWLNEVGLEGWYAQSDARDAEIARRFEGAVEEAAAGRYWRWQQDAEGVLALVILLDQFPRNIWRGTEHAYRHDRKALAVACTGIAHGFDRDIPEPQRQFFYLPLMHAESLPTQERCVRLMMMRMPRTGRENLAFALQHRADIRQFGRFPYRNAALGRDNTTAEADWLAARA